MGERDASKASGGHFSGEHRHQIEGIFLLERTRHGLKDCICTVKG